MGRPKQFDRDSVLEKATELFRRHGFGATSTQHLVDVLEINKKSLYDEFGSKQGLFEAVLERYDREAVERNFGPLESASAGLDEIRRVVMVFANASSGKGRGLGCLLCNTAVDGGNNERSTRIHVEHYFSRIVKAFENALRRAKKREECIATVHVRTEARFLCTSIMGLAVLARARADPAIADASARAILAHVGALSTGRRNDPGHR